MPKKIVFTDGEDDFFLDTSGNLMKRDISSGYEESEKTLLRRDDLREFLAWLTDEVNRIEAAR